MALIRSYADGVTDDEAFKAATGQDMAGFETAWLADIKADAPKSFGPVLPARARRRPTGLAGPVVPVGSAAPGPSASPSGVLPASRAGRLLRRLRSAPSVASSSSASVAFVGPPPARPSPRSSRRQTTPPIDAPPPPDRA